MQRSINRVSAVSRAVLHRREQHALWVQLRGATRDLRAHPLYEEEVGRPACRLIAALPAEHQPAATISALFALRWSELERLRPAALHNPRSVLVPTTKGGRPRVCSYPWLADVDGLCSLDRATPWLMRTYDEHQKAIQSAARAAGLWLGGRHHRGTHIWRHLRAWHDLSCGRATAETAKTLGHRSLRSTAAYTGSRADARITHS